MKTSKRLLSVALSAVLLFGSAFSALADDAVTTVQYISGTVTASNVSANAGDTEVTVPVEIKFEGQQVSPHGMFDITADGATLKSATLTNFDNANFEPDEAVPDGAGSVDKSVYVEEEDVNTANGRIVVESSTDESKQPATTYVKLDVVLGFATELTAGQEIEVVISNIQATNLSEYGWDGMSAVNGKITVEADEPECDHDWEVVSATPAEGEGTSTSNNVETKKGSIELKCSKCDETETQEVSYWNRYTFNYYNLNIASQIELVYNLRVSRLTETAGNVQDVFVKAVTAAETENVTTYITGVLEIDSATVSGNECKPVGVGVPAKQMVDNITATVFVKRDGVWYSGLPRVKSVEQQVHEMYSLVADKERTLYANLLVFGSKAQTYFSYRLDQLADANLGDYSTYVTNTTPTLTNDCLNDYTDPCIRTTTQSMSVAAKTEAVITFRADKLSPIPAKEAITVKATYADGSDVVEKIYASDVFAPEGRENRYIVNVDSVYPKYMRKAVTVKFLADGVETNSTFTFSIAGLCQKVIETVANLSQNEKDMYYAMINYADAAAAYFNVVI